MTDTYPKYRAASVQAAPVFLDRDATIEKACGLVSEAAGKGARLVVFPEAFIPGYPYWIWLDLPQSTGQWYKRLYAEAVEIPSKATEKLCRAAKAADACVVIGLNEKASNDIGSLWNTNLVIDRHGAVLGKCRKLMPTRAEKMVWALGDGASLRVFDTDVGKLGTLICGVNANPLARFALLAQGEQVHVANYPAFPNFTYEIDIRAKAHSHEGRVFTLVSTSTVSHEIKELLGGSETSRKWLSGCGAYSAVYGPDARVIADLKDEEGIVYADIDIEREVEQRQIMDIVGHSARPDVLSLNLVTEERNALNSKGADSPSKAIWSG